MTDLGLENLSHTSLAATPRPAAALGRFASTAGGMALGVLKVLVTLPEAYARAYSSLFFPGPLMNDRKREEEDY